jgi:hypothetical protein
MWTGGGEETVSGAGSTLAYTASLRPAFEHLLRRLGVKTLVDAGCGDFNWMSHVNLEDVHYSGFDIIAKVVRRNRLLYGSRQREFHKADVTIDPLPRADLMLCRDCVFHLPFADIWRLLDNFVRSETKHLLLTNQGNAANVDLPRPGGYKPRNFTRMPFMLPLPPLPNRIVDNPEGRANRCLYLWTWDEIRDALDEARRDGRYS